jgi:SAM-dependent methyltransferase
VAAYNWLAERINRRQVVRHAHLLTGELLDVGCGQKPYERLLAPRLSRYVGLEHPETRHHREKVDVWGDAAALPFDDASFDTVVSFQVLEHVPEPREVLAEMHRVLRPGGTLFVTTPFMWGIHEAPRDFYRYTPYALQHLLGGAGFEAVVVTPVCGYWATTGLRFSYYLRRFARGPVEPAVRMIQHVVQGATMLLDRLQRVDSDAGGYATVARRPA